MSRTTQPAAPPTYGLVIVVHADDTLATFLVRIADPQLCLALDQAESRDEVMSSEALMVLLPDSVVVRAGGTMRLEAGERVAQIWNLATADA